MQPTTVAQPLTGITPLIVTVIEAQNLPVRDVVSKTDPFVVVEAGGVRNQTEVVRGQVNPIWDHMCTLRARFGPGVREELRVLCWHEDVYEDVILGVGTLNIAPVLHERETMEVWLELLDERMLRATGAEVLVRIQNGKAAPLAELCASEELELEQIESSISQDPSQCDERNVVDEPTGKLCLHVLLGNHHMTTEMLNALLKCNPRQATVADKHGTLPLSYLCRRYGLQEEQLEFMIKCNPAAARTPNRFGKLALHFLARNPTLNRRALGLVLTAFPGAVEAKDQSGNLPLHYLTRNHKLSKDVLQAFMEACGEARGKAYAETRNKVGVVTVM